MKEPTKSQIAQVMRHLTKGSHSKAGRASAARMSAAERIERARMAGRASGLARKRKAQAKREGK